MVAQSSHPIAVRLRGVKKGFGAGATRIEVLRGVDLEARRGEMLLLVGPSGCGKTTLLSVISGLLDSEGGEVEVFGQGVHAMSAKEKTAFRKQTVGFVFQQYNLVPTLTAAENASLKLLVNGEERHQAVRRAREMLERVRMGHRADARPAELSGGEMQRVAIARAIIGDPKLLICDEPTAALDGETGQKVLEVLREVGLREDRCVIVVTHDSRIFKFGDRIARMVDGRIDAILDAREAGSDVLRR